MPNTEDQAMLQETSRPETIQFNIFQQIFQLSMLSNGASNQGGTVESLRKFLEEKTVRRLKELHEAGKMPEWKISWGPQVFVKSPRILVENAMIVFSNDLIDVVAIAGTNPGSIVTWLQNANVEPAKRVRVEWPGAPTGTLIAGGVSEGLNTLRNMTAPGASGPTLANFLKKQAGSGKNRTLIFTGHSLGGALSPTLALFLFTEGGLDVKSWKEVKVYPTAGFSPGNKEFADFFNTRFKASENLSGLPHEVWNRQVWNTFDVVPRAWDRDTLTGLETLYGDQMDDSSIVAVKTMQDTARSRSGSEYKQLQSIKIISGKQPVVHKFIEYGREMTPQHTHFYFEMFKIDRLSSGELPTFFTDSP
jgi:hypothetical protein